MKKVFWILLAFAALAAFVLEYLEEPHYAWESIPGVYALLGFIGCFLLAAVAKGLGAAVLFKDEDYYDAD